MGRKKKEKTVVVQLRILEADKTVLDAVAHDEHRTQVEQYRYELHKSADRYRQVGKNETNKS